MRKVLIISNPDDEHTAVVVEKIAQRGAESIAFWPEQLGQRRQLSLVIEGAHSATGAILLRDNATGQSIDLRRIDAIWYRRPRIPALQEFSLSQMGTDFARDEWRSALDASYALLNDALWVSHPDRLTLAARKPVQQAIALTLGLEIPRTLITNSPEDALEFIDSCNGTVVVKPTGSGWTAGSTPNGAAYVLTNRLGEADAGDLDDARISPVTFQEEIPKRYELRVNVIGQRLLAIRIDSQASEISTVDWRRYDVANTPYTPYALPSSLAERLLQLTQTLGLQFGAIDLIRESSGRYVFLEINGNGQFLWAEQLSGVDVSGALADLLAGGELPLGKLSAAQSAIAEGALMR